MLTRPGMHRVSDQQRPGQRCVPGSTPQTDGVCDGSFYVNLTGLRAALSAGKTYFWVCLIGCFRKRLVFEPVDGVKQTCTPPPRPVRAGGHHPISGGSP